MLLSQLKYFAVVARLEHISHAASELHVAQPAVSATISKLEKEFRTPLFNRVGRKIVLNEAGKRLYEQVLFMEQAEEDLKKELDRLHESIENTLVFSVSNSIYFRGWLQLFVTQNPQIQLKQKMLREPEMIDALLDESIDLALGEFHEDVPGIERRKIIEDEYVVLIPSDHPLAKKERITFEDIQAEQVSSFPSNNTTKIVDQIFEKQSAVPNVMFEGNARMQLKLLMWNRGLAFTSKQMTYMSLLYDRKTISTQLDQELSFEQIDAAERFAVIRTISDVDTKVDFSICWKADRELPDMAARFLDAITKQYPDYNNDPMFLDALKAIDRGL